MTRFGRRDMVKALRAPAPDPPPELGQRIKQQIPEDLFSTGRVATPARAFSSRGRASWALAASIVVAIGAGYLAARRFDEQRDSSPELAVAIDALEAPSSAPVAAAPAAPPPAPRRAEEPGAAPPEQLQDESSRQRDLAAVAPQPAEAPQLAEAPPQTRADAERDATAAEEREVTVENRKAAKAVAGIERRAAVDSTAAPAPAQARRRNDALAESARSLQAGGSGVVPMADLLDAAAARPGATRDDISVEGMAARTPGHVVALVSVIAVRSGTGDGAPSADAIDLELDPTVTRGYRLLASSAHALATPGPQAGRAASAPLYRLSALYEIELAAAAPGARDFAPAAILGSVRWSGGDGPTPGSVARDRVSILITPWDDARAELRLAVLAAELALLPHDAPASRIAPIERDLDRLLADTERDPTLSRRAAELKAIASERARVP